MEKEKRRHATEGEKVEKKKEKHVSTSEETKETYHKKKKIYSPEVDIH